MGTSAFEVLIAPIFVGTLGIYLACAAIFSLLYAVGKLAGRIHRWIQAFDDIHGAEWQATGAAPWALHGARPARELGRTIRAG